MGLCKIDSKNKRVFDESIQLKDNAMLKHRPELFYEWDFEKNDELGLDIYKVSQGSGKIAWWNCPDCKSVYDMPVLRRRHQNINCPYCSGRRVNYTNSLASLNPELAKEWHPTRNGKLTPHDVTYGNNKKVWWMGKCLHEWDASVNNRNNKGSGCPVCDNKIILKGFNDMWTTNPELASMLANPEDGYRYMQFSNKRVDWICLECDNIIKNKKISNISVTGLSCPRCSDGISFSEKIVFNLLRKYKIDFAYDAVQSWSKKKRYDFYLPYYNTIIETHGEQHYGHGFEGYEDGRTLAEEQENDKLKYELAKENGIDKYIMIDCRESNMKWIKSSIVDSELKNIIDLDKADWEEIGRLASNSLVKRACDLWMSGIHSTEEIAEIMKMNRTTIRKYLKMSAEIGWCDYCPKEARKHASIKGAQKRQKCIIQMLPCGILLNKWSSIYEAKEELGGGDIIASCRGRNKTAGGFKWMYKSDYDHMLSLNMTHEEYMNTYYPQSSKSTSKSKQ